MLMLRMILAGSYEFTSPEWDDRSDTVKDLVRLVQTWEYSKQWNSLVQLTKPTTDLLTCGVHGLFNLSDLQVVGGES